MRFKQFLIENSSPTVSVAEMNNIIEILKRDCAPFLRETRGVDLSIHGLYRGSEKTLSDPITKKYVRKDRRPLDTDRIKHEIIDDWFLDNYGFRARSQSVFVSPNSTFAKRYGTPYIVFPIGEYKYVWSALAPDLFVVTSSTSQEDLQTTLEESHYSDTDLAHIMEKNYKLEVMVHCDSYYMIPSHVWNDIMYFQGAKLTESVSLNDQEALQRFGCSIVDQMTIDNYNLALVENPFEMCGTVYQLGFSKVGTDFTDYTQQHKKFIPMDPIPLSKLSQAIGKLKTWIEAHGPILIASDNENRTSTYRKVLMRAGISTEIEECAGKLVLVVGR